MTAPRAAVGALLVTALLFVAETADAPGWLRTPMALVVFLAAPGAALVTAMGPVPAVLRWSLVVGLSVAVGLLAAVFLLAVQAFSIRSFLLLLLALEAAAIVVPALLSQRAGAGADRSRHP